MTSSDDDDDLSFGSSYDRAVERQERAGNDSGPARRNNKGRYMHVVGFVHETAKAYLLRLQEVPGKDIWVPKSQIMQGDPANDDKIMVSDWWCGQNGI
jgi:hypothetical protein